MFMTRRGQLGVAKVIFLQMRDAQRRVLAIPALGVFVYQELIRIHRGLIVTSAEAVTHLRIQFGGGQQRLGHFHCMRGDQINAAVAGNNLFVLGECALVRRLAVEDGALLLRPRELHSGSLALYARSARCEDRRSGEKAQRHKRKRQRHKNWRNTREAPDEILSPQHHARPASLSDLECPAKPGPAQSFVKTTRPPGSTSLWIARGLNHASPRRPEPGRK